jgi:DNA oxidative demethylase
MDLFADLQANDTAVIPFGSQAFIFRCFALSQEQAILTALRQIIAHAPLRSMVTPGGQQMSVKTTSCGPFGWVSDRRGYRYEGTDPLSGKSWPLMPPAFYNLATTAAAHAGFNHFQPDACLINQYEIGSKMGLHQDKDEVDFSQPIVSVSLGIPATFLFGGLKRADNALRIALRHCDVVVWGDADRLRYHGVLPIQPDVHPALGPTRINLTFRRAR